MKPVLYSSLCVSLGLALTLQGCADESEARADEPVASSSQSVAATEASAIRDVSVAEAKTLIAENDELVVLDVRTPEEFDAGHIDGAINVDFRSADFASELAKLNRDTPYLLYCRSGNRSGQTLELMKEQNFQRVAHMNAGFNGWTAEEQSEQ